MGNRRAINPPPPSPRETAFQPSGRAKRDSDPPKNDLRRTAVAALMQGLALADGVMDLNELRTSSPGEHSHPVIVDEAWIAEDERKKHQGKKRAENPKRDSNRPSIV